ncbi:hypothetical protein IPF37_00335 [bacterium]|nr:MAG: hypothetical protein IPF37_00335 [bacterium]
MKKIVLTLVLSLGLANATYAAAPEQATKQADSNAVIAWMKANPKKATALIASVLVVAASGTVYYNRNKACIKPRLDSAKDGLMSAKTKVVDKANATYESAKAHPYITAAIVTSTLAVAGLVTYDLTRDESKLKKLAKSIRKALCGEDVEIVA